MDLSKVIEKIKCKAGLYITVISVVIIIIYLVIMSAESRASSNKNDTEIVLAADETTQFIVDDTSREYKDIINHTFSVTDDNDLIANSVVNTSLIIDGINEYLDSSKYSVKAIGILGDKIYIMQDRSEPVNNLKCGISTVDRDIDINSWLQILEELLSTYNIQAYEVFIDNSDIKNNTVRIVYVYSVDE